jgi:hypothetical protein
VYTAYDLVMPWAVGRYGDQPSFQNLYQTVASEDIPFAQQNNLGYLTKREREREREERGKKRKIKEKKLMQN